MVSNAINNVVRKFPHRAVILLGIEGDLVWGARTLQEWTFLIEDVDGQVRAGEIHVRPESQRFPFTAFTRRIEEAGKDPPLKIDAMPNCVS